MDYAIELRELTKKFGSFTANDGISFSVEKGEIHALAGENGAGKTTLMNMLYGLYIPTSGQILIDGKEVHFKDSKDSIAHGIGMVHQHFMLVPKLTVAENIILGQETGKGILLDRKLAIEQIRALSEQYGLNIDPEAKVCDLSVTMQQRVEILKVLYRKANILIFDEPTAVLTPQEIEEFCEILLNLKAQGKTILFISHKLAEVMKVSDHVTVIRRGKIIGTVKTQKTTPAELTKMMVGREVIMGGGERTCFESPRECLCVNGVSCTVNKTVKKVDDLSLTVHEGEILGVAGVDGNGQEELVQLICGLVPPDSGNILLDGAPIAGHNIRQIKEMGLGYIPEDRHRDGLVLDFSIAENIALGQQHRAPFGQKGMLNRKEIAQYAEELERRFDIRCGSIQDPASTLSGGNQQKIVIAREVSRNPKIIVAVQPTRGLDVGAIEYIHKALVEQRNQGKAILLFSLELDEILALSDRIAVMFKGRVVGIVDAKTATKEQLGMMMLGQIQIEKGEQN